MRYGRRKRIREHLICAAIACALVIGCQIQAAYSAPAPAKSSTVVETQTDAWWSWCYGGWLYGGGYFWWMTGGGWS